MNEARLQEIERDLDGANARTAAAIAFAAIYRIGELGAPAAAAFARHADGAFRDPDVTAFTDGWRAISGVLAPDKVS